jgi:hypothetical protein
MCKYEVYLVKFNSKKVNKEGWSSKYGSLVLALSHGFATKRYPKPTPDDAVLDGIAAGMYQHIGAINADSIDEAYAKLQNTDESHELHSSSLSIGDMLGVNGKAFLVDDGFKFTELQPEIAALLPHIPDRDL